MSQAQIAETESPRAATDNTPTFEEMAARWREFGDPFDLINTASERVRPAVVSDWFAYEDYRAAYGVAFAAMTDDRSGEFEEDSPLDGLAYGAFVEGWSMALRRVGEMLGVHPEVFRNAIEIAGEIGRDALSANGLAALRKVSPMLEDCGDSSRYFKDVELALSA